MEKKSFLWSHFFGESGIKTERFSLTSHEVSHEGKKNPVSEVLIMFTREFGIHPLVRDEFLLHITFFQGGR